MIDFRGVFRNPLTLYLRYMLQAARNRRKFTDFSQGYMSRVDNCDFESHVRVFPGAVLSNCRVGSFSYVAADAKISDATIGRFCSIAPDCRIGLGRHPAREMVSTSPVFFSTARQCGTTFVDSEKFLETARVTIGNDVWIGANATVMDGLRLGHGAIIGAGAVVVRDVPDYAIVGGVPARIIRMRFTESEIGWLLSFRWWDKDEQWIRENHEQFLEIQRFISSFDPTGWKDKSRAHSGTMPQSELIGVSSHFETRCK